MGQAQQRLFRAGLVAAHHGAAADALFSHGRLVVLNSDMMWRSQTVRLPARTVARCWSAFPARRRTACRAWKRPRRWRCRASAWTIPQAAGSGPKRLEEEISARYCPMAAMSAARRKRCWHAYRYLTMVMDALAAASEEPPHELAQCPRPHGAHAALFPPWRRRAGAVPWRAGKRSAHDRRAAGARRGARPAFPPCPPFSGYQRLAAGRSICNWIAAGCRQVLLRCDAHAGFLAFELSSGQRPAGGQLRRGRSQSSGWDAALRATAAHSTLTLADTSSAQSCRRAWRAIFWARA